MIAPATVPTGNRPGHGVGPLHVLVVAESTPAALRAAIDRTPRIVAEYRPPAHAVRLGRARSYDVALIVATAASVRCGWLLKQLGWRIVLLTWPGAEARVARRGRRIADAVFDWEGRAEDGPDALAATAAEAAGRPGAGLSAGPPVSVVTTVLDEEENVASLIHQVHAQLQLGDELVIVDGGSRDGTLARIEALAAGDSRLRCISAPGTNISAGRNVGIRESRNPVIATTDAGCELSPGWLEALRRPFGEREPVGLVAGNCAVRAQGAFELAQALACYPDPLESRFPSLFVRVYGRLFGCTFDPTLPFARSLAFTREAWELVGGFPEHLNWVEDGVFGRRIAQHRRCAFAADAVVTWRQRQSLKATVFMYLTYGRGAAKSGDRQLVGRDILRLVAYVGSVAAVTRGRLGVIAVLAGGSAYLSLPLARVLRYHAGLTSGLCVPVVLAAKDLAKVGGAVSARLVPAPDLRSQWPPWKPPAD